MNEGQTLMTECGTIVAGLETTSHRTKPPCKRKFATRIRLRHLRHNDVATFVDIENWLGFQNRITDAESRTNDVS